jgi:dTDP-4-amino-4,6-dideoxygalactose transaminase
MKAISMVDLKGQYDRLKPEIDEAIHSVLNNTAFIKGPEVGDFQDALADYMGTQHCIACANGTDALQLAMMALNLSPGDEVITTPFTFIATVEVIRLLGLKPVLADVESDTFNIDPRHLRSLVNERTKAIVPVHLFGQSADMESIMQIAHQHDLYVIEDNAQATGARYTFSDGRSMKTGTIGTIGCTSFFPSKNLGCFGDGGALLTSDPVLADELRSLANHGMSERYYYDRVGVNSRLDTLQAAILRVKLKHLDAFNRARQEAASYYDSAFESLAGVSIPARNPASTHIFHQYTLQVDPAERDSLKLYLKEKNIPSMIYYPVPIHLQKAYSDLGYGKGDFPVSEDLSKKVLSLPMHTELDREQMDHITGSVIAYFKR